MSLLTICPTLPQKLSLAALLLVPAAAYHTCDDDQRSTYPKLCTLLDDATADESTFADMLSKSPISTIMPNFDLPKARTLTTGDSPLPIVVAHGMGDSCFNSGMKSITKAAGLQVGSYSTCIPTGELNSEPLLEPLPELCRALQLLYLLLQ